MVERAELQAFDARLLRMEGEVRRVHDEVEACSVLILSLDAAGPGAGSAPNRTGMAPGSRSTSVSPRDGRGIEADLASASTCAEAAVEAVAEVASVREEAKKLATRLGVLEDSWALRGERATMEAEEVTARLEKELLDVWREVRAQASSHLPPLRELTMEMQQGLQELRDQVALVDDRAARNPMLSDPQAVGGLMEAMAAGIAESTAELERRCNLTEEHLGRLGGQVHALLADKQRVAELEQMVELLAQQRREDIVATNSQLREVDMRFHEISRLEERDGSWRVQAEVFRRDLEDLRTAQVPAVLENGSRATKLVAQGLHALRAEVQALNDRVESECASIPRRGSGSVEAGSLTSGQDMATLRAKVDQLQREVNHRLSDGLDERIISLRADVSAEVERACRESRDAWGGASRRLVDLEVWPKQLSTLHAEVQHLSQQFREERQRVGVMIQDEIMALRAGFIVNGGEPLSSRVKRQESRALPNFSPSSPQSPGQSGSPRRGRSSSPERRVGSPVPRGDLASSALVASSAVPLRDAYGGAMVGAVAANTASSGSTAEPMVLGRRVEWPISGGAVATARRNKRPLVMGECDVAGTRVRLKFFPGGSSARQSEGNCSLYLVASDSVVVRFYLFAGKHVSPLLECSYERKRDQGQHDLCCLSDVLDHDGGVVVGVEILEIRQFSPGPLRRPAPSGLEGVGVETG